MNVLVTDVTDPVSGGKIAVSFESGIAYPLTTCCGATGKGGGHGVICRSCYEDVDYSFGGGWTIDAMPAEFAADVEAAIAKAKS